MIKIGICDDELTVHNQVKQIVSKCNFDTQLEIIDFMCGQELLGYEETIDILLLDICMPEMDGIAVGHLLKRRRNIGKIIMLTSMTERFEEAFEIEAYRFVVKPIDEKKLIKAIEDTLGTFIGNAVVEVYLESKKYSFKQKDIAYISKMHSRTEVIIGEAAFQSIQSLTEWEKVLDDRLFFQTHKSYIVNLSKVDRIEDKIYLISGEVLPVAKRRKNDLMQKYMEYDLRYR